MTTVPRCNSQTVLPEWGVDPATLAGIDTSALSPRKAYLPHLGQRDLIVHDETFLLAGQEVVQRVQKPPMPSDHLFVVVEYALPPQADEPALIVGTWNVGGTSFGLAGCRDIGSAPFTPHLYRAFVTVRSRSVDEVLSPLAGHFSAARVSMAKWFFCGEDNDSSGPFGKWSPKRRAVSRLVQYAAGVDQHGLLAFLYIRIKQGKSAIDAAIEAADVIDITPAAYWDDTHVLPINPETGERLARDDVDQIHINLVAWLVYIASVIEICPDGFVDLLDQSPPFRTPSGVFDTIRAFFGTVHVLALQEVHDCMVDQLDRLCTEHGYSLIIDRDARKARAALVIRKDLDRLDVKSFGPMSSERGVSSVISIAGHPVGILSVHGCVTISEPGKPNLTQRLASEFRETCLSHGVDHFIVAGDFQVGKHPEGRDGVLAELNAIFDNRCGCSKTRGTRLDDPPNIVSPFKLSLPHCCDAKSGTGVPPEQEVSAPVGRGASIYTIVHSINLAMPKTYRLNKPVRNPSGSRKKFHVSSDLRQSSLAPHPWQVYTKNGKGHVVKVQFGDSRE